MKRVVAIMLLSVSLLLVGCSSTSEETSVTPDREVAVETVDNDMPTTAEENVRQSLETSFDGNYSVTFLKQSKTYQLTPVTENIVNELNQCILGQVDSDSWLYVRQPFMNFQQSIAANLGPGYNLLLVHPYDTDATILLATDNGIEYDFIADKFGYVY